MKYQFNQPLKYYSSNYDLFEGTVYYCGEILLEDGALVAVKKSDWLYTSGINNLNHYTTDEFSKSLTEEQIKKIKKTFNEKTYAFRFVRLKDLQTMAPYTLQDILTQLDNDITRS